MINGRITPDQMEWLQERADELGGNLSAALRQTISDARFLELARADYENLLKEHPRFKIPRHKDDDTSRAVEVVLAFRSLRDPGDLELREEEGG